MQFLNNYIKLLKQRGGGPDEDAAVTKATEDLDAAEGNLKALSQALDDATAKLEQARINGAATGDARDAAAKAANTAADLQHCRLRGCAPSRSGG